ncbi:MAG: RecX family transcriptional regulator [Myxococcota bacterium]
MYNTNHTRRRRRRSSHTQNTRASEHNGDPQQRGRRRRKPRPLAEGTITRIATQRRNPSRVSVYLDGQFAFGLVQDIVLDFGLHSGQLLTIERQQEVLQANGLIEARSKALEYISFKPRSEQEVRDKLHSREFSKEAIDAAIGRLKELGYLDDGRYAEAFARDRVVVQRYGPRRIERELHKRGVAATLIVKALGTLTAEQVEEAATAAADGRWRSLRTKGGLTVYARRRKLYSFLARRGFGADMVRRILERMDLEVGAAEEVKPERSQKQGRQPNRTGSSSAQSPSSSIDRETALAWARKRWKVLLRLEPNARKRSQKLWAHLRRKGVSTELIRSVSDTVVAEYAQEEEAHSSATVVDEDQAQAEALELARKRWRVLKRLESNARKRTQKLKDYLRRRAVNGDVIREVVDRVVNEG